MSIFFKLEEINNQLLLSDSLRNNIEKLRDWCQNEDIASRFVGLALRDSWDEEIRTRDELSTLAEEELGFNLDSVFNRQVVNPLKRKYKIDVVKRNNYLYLRTLQKLTGKMFVGFASSVSRSIRNNGWATMNDSEKLRNALQDKYNSYHFHEEDISLDDIVDFFRELVELHEYYQASFSSDEVMARFPELPHVVINRLMNELQVEYIEQEQETKPQLSLDNGNRLIYSFPEKGHFNKNDPVVFYLKDNEDKTLTWVKYVRNNDGEWIKRLPASVPPSAFSVKKVHNISRQDSPDVNLVPIPCITQDHLILKLKEGEQVGLATDNNKNCIIEANAGIKLEEGKRYFIAFLSSSNANIKIIYDDEEQEYELNDNILDLSEIAADIVMVNNVVYDVKGKEQWLNTDTGNYVNEWLKCANHLKAFFLKSGGIPVFPRCLTENATLVYEYDNTQITLWNGQTCTPISQEWLWRDGRLIYSENGDNEHCHRRQVTFLPNIDWGDDIDAPIAWGEQKDVTIRIEGEREIICHVAGDATFVELEVNGYQFRRAVPRYGVCVDIAGERVPLNPYGITQIARKDLASVVFSLTLNPQNDDHTKVIITRGLCVTNIEKRVKNIRYTQLIGKRRYADLQKTSNDYYSINFINTLNINDNQYFKFHVYDPITTKITNNKYIRYKWTDMSLSVSSFLPILRKDCDKYLVYVPAHRQDGGIKSVRCDKQDYEFDEEKRLISTLTFDNFADKVGDDWGNGLLCFIARMISTNPAKYEICTSGFFLPPPVGMSQQVQFDDDPYGIRRALSNTSNPDTIETITEILHTQNNECQEYLKNFFENLNSTFLPLKQDGFNVFNYLNCYHNTVYPNIPSGYIFMADWYFAKRLGDMQQEEIFSYGEYWDAGMFVYDKLTCPVSIRKEKLRISNFGEEMWREFYSRKLDNHVKDLTELLEQYLPSGYKRKLHKHLKEFGCINDNNVNLQEPYVSCSMPLFFTSDQLSNIIRQHGCPDITRAENRRVRAIISALRDGREIWGPGEGNNTYDDRNGLVSHLYEIFQEHLEQLPYFFRTGMGPTIRFVRSANEVVPLFDSSQLKSFMLMVGEKLHIWRNNPNLKDAQELRELLLFLRHKVDGNVIASIDEQNADDYVGIRTLIEDIAWLKHFNLLHNI